MLLQAPAHAETDPLGDLAKTLQTGSSQVTKSLSGGKTASTPSQNAPDAPSSDSDSPGHETANPVSPDHGSAYVNKTKLGDNELVGIGSSNATVNDDDSTSADTTMLSIGGTAVPGTTSHADSDNAGAAGFNVLGPLTTPICEGSAGGVCLSVIYGNSSATNDGTTSESHSDGGLAAACVGGSDETGATCDGPVQAGVATTSSSAQRDQRSGRTTAQSSSEVADVCLGQEPVVGCGLGVNALSSSGESDSDGSADRRSNLAGIKAGGNAILPDQTDPVSIAIGPDCEPTLVCVFGNQGETYAGPALAGHAQEALALAALPNVAALVIGQSETLVHNDGRTVVEPPIDVLPPKAGGGNSGAGEPSDGVLPNTGGVWAGWLSLGFLVLAAGAGLFAFGRRRIALTA